jgi:hypothetical protein
METLLEENGRKHERHTTIGLMSNISDGKSTFVGVIQDISRNGLRISQVPANFDDTADRCCSVVNGLRDDFLISLQPRWSRLTNRGMYKMIGFEIKDPPGSWTSFIEGGTENMENLGFLIPSRVAA